ncbi:unnamed protein product, partial [marine sediment metagenome]
MANETTVVHVTHESVLEKRALVAEHFVDVKIVVVGLLDNIIEHRIVAGMFFYDAAHRGHLVSTKNR